MRAQIAEQIKAEIALQVEEQVKDQFLEHIPISLEEQAAQSQRQLIEVRNSLTNRYDRTLLSFSVIDNP